MDLTKDFRIASCGESRGFAGFPAPRGAPDWSGLYARLSAAHALRREMTCESVRVGPLGSFSDWRVPRSGEAHGKPHVNLKDSTDRKGPWGIAAGTAGLVHAGDREQ